MKNFDNQIEAETEAIFRAMEPQAKGNDMTRLRAAFQLAKEAHSKQKRKSGEPYIIHPVTVAHIAATEINLDINSVITAFLHDVVEDTSYTIEDIQERFGDDVAYLVNIVTKKEKKQYEMSKQLDNYKQMLDSVHYDLRGLLIKLADRLHNMRTLDSMRPDKQMKIAGETDYFYAPLANRLGLYDIKTELENLSLRYRCPQEYAQLEESLRKDESKNKEWLDIFTRKISDILSDNNIKARIDVQYRMPYSIWRKMHRSGCDFEHVDYRHITRLVFKDQPNVSNKQMCLNIYSMLTDKFKEKPGSFINYVDAPKENGYQSLHIKLLSDRGAWEEVHIHSEEMLRTASMGCVNLYKSNVGRWIEKFKAILQDIIHNQGVNNEDFMESVVTSFYNDDIMVFTPQGLGISLPSGASALDFAFEIHTKVGLHACYARINGKLCSVKNTLLRGDCVEIFTNPKSEPQSDWLDYITTYKAKKNVHAHLRRKKKLPNQRCMHCQPLPGDEVIGFVKSDGSTIIHKRDCKIAISTASQDGDSIVGINFEEDSEFLYPAMVTIKAIDRYHLLSDLIDCITNRLHLSIDKLHTETVDAIVNCSINFSVHSKGELLRAIDYINTIDCVDEVRHEVKINS